MLFYAFEFMYLFLPVAVIGYYLVGGRSRKAAVKWIVACSLFFYGWWNPVYVIFLAGSILFNYWTGLVLRERKSRLMLIFGICVNLGFIGYFKYAGFMVSVFNDVAGRSVVLHDIVLPLGISFFTFQQISWLIDNYAGRIAAKDRGLWEYGQFVMFFPQLIAGPIVHHSEMMPQFHQDANRFVNWRNMAAGLSIFVIGLAKKVVVADMAAPYANTVFSLAKDGQALLFPDAWIGALAYTVQIYFDFSGYADMAIGLALMFNIVLPLNFDSPYKSRSISMFWRRWHMTLGRFLRDYVYIPMGGSRCSRFRSSLNLFITMFICGIWHGAGWTFILWGAVHGLFLMVQRLWSWFSPVRLPGVVATGLTFVCVVFAWVLFRAESLPEAAIVIKSMAGLSGFGTGGETAAHALAGPDMVRAWVVILPALLAAFLLPNSQTLMGNALTIIQPVRTREKSGRVLTWKPNAGWAGYMVILSLVSLYCLLDQSNVQEFIYFQF